MEQQKEITPEEAGLSQKICRHLKKHGIYKLNQLEEHSEFKMRQFWEFSLTELYKVSEACRHNGIIIDRTSEKKRKAENEHREAVKKSSIYRR